MNDTWSFYLTIRLKMESLKSEGQNKSMKNLILFKNLLFFPRDTSSTKYLSLLLLSLNYLKNQ
jgi:hypothetical protein